MVFVAKKEAKKVIISQEKDIERLRKHVSTLNSKIQKLSKTKDAEPAKDDTNLKNELLDLKEKYIFLLEKVISLQSQKNQNVPIATSDNPPSQPKMLASLGDMQVLLLLKNGKATSKEFAVTALQLKQAFNINKTTRTIRKRLSELEKYNLVVSLGKKPKTYFITPSGLSLLAEQKRTLIQTNETFK